MNKQRKPIDMAALVAVTLPQRDPVAAVVERPPESSLREVVPIARPEPTPKAAIKPKPKAAPPTVRRASRGGKVGVQAWVTPEIRKALHHYATDNDTTLADLMDEALRDLIGKLKIA